MIILLFQYNTLFPFSVSKAACDHMTKALALGKNDFTMIFWITSFRFTHIIIQQLSS